MRLSAIALLAGVAAVAADQTVTLFLPGFDAQSIEGKVIGSVRVSRLAYPERNHSLKTLQKGSVTSYVLNCPADADENDCGLPESGYTVIEGPSTLKMSYSYDDFSVNQACDLKGTTSAACSASYVDGGKTSQISTEIAVASIPYGGYQEVRLTATETGASATTGASGSATTATATATTAGTAASTSAEKTESTSTNAALPAVTAKAPWAVGGVAAALALVV
ncbi:hypothetical protein N7492_000256 [Penicillium capsulatum]|uniref:GPI anchored cell wall protein n=1 Tax=Penicillium capsulatum TaxID=69766 RepID=A0A9W9IT65_9EURO|nr:hypothetical protein N7492_000256 [Penicillium capsulatum]KAJ6130678.1 hypothetical protein N7512_003458 [Penicillium capsulatum]